MKNKKRLIASSHRTIVSLLIVAGLAVLAIRPLVAQQVQENSPVILLGKVSGYRALPSGMQLQSGGATMQVTAVADGVLRVQISPVGGIVEHPSWAVLPASLNGRLTVRETGGPNRVGFVTGDIHVDVERSSMRLIVTDGQGRVIVADAVGYPVEFHGHSFTVHKTMQPTEHFFGLGDKAGPLDHRDQAFTMWNTDAYHWQESTDPLYKSIPFFLAMHDGIGYGIFLDNTWRTSFNFGKELRDTYSFGSDDGALDYYILTGEQPKDVIRRYARLTGPPAMPPRWALGFQQSRWSYYPEAKVREIAKRLRDDGIPTDVLYLDIDYQDRNRPFTVDRTRFPGFEQLIADLRKEHFHTIAITDLHIADAPRGEYPVFDSGVSGNHFVHNPDGSTYSGRVWPGLSSFPEFTSNKTRAWWGKLYSDFYGKDNVAGFWNDMNEPSVFGVPTKTMPLTTIHRVDEPGWPTRNASHAEIHNVYGMLNSRATYEGLEQLKPEQRPFVLTRASYAGGQRYAATWTGDNTATWNHLRIGIHQLVNLGLSGFAFSGNDVGGYAGSPSMELLTRWLEVAAFAPIDRDHTEKGTADQEPWVGGEEQENIRRRYIEERYRLMPYLYTLASEANRDGVPLMRPLFLEFPHARKDGAPIDVANDNQFMLGSALLVAPAPFAETQDDYDIVFPESTSWFDYWTGKAVAMQRSTEDLDEPPFLLHKHPRLDELPVYVRAGSIVPREPLTQSTDETPKGPLELRVYPPAPGMRGACEGELYTDDGESFNYRKGQFYRVRTKCQEAIGDLEVSMSGVEGSYTPWWHEFEIVIYGVASRPSSLLLNGVAVSAEATLFDPATGTVHVRVPASQAGWTLSIRQ